MSVSCASWRSGLRRDRRPLPACKLTFANRESNAPSWPGPGFPLGRRKLTLAGPIHASKVSLPAWSRTLTAGDKPPVVKGRFSVGQGKSGRTASPRAGFWRGRALTLPDTSSRWRGFRQLPLQDLRPVSRRARNFPRYAKKGWVAAREPRSSTIRRSARTCSSEMSRSNSSRSTVPNSSGVSTRRRSLSPLG